MESTYIQLEETGVEAVRRRPQSSRRSRLAATSGVTDAMNAVD